jgi:hypothetical protein
LFSFFLLSFSLQCFCPPPLWCRPFSLLL